MTTTEDVLAALRVVQDPDLERDIVSLGFVKNVVVEGGRVAFDVELTTPACPVKDVMKRQAEEAVEALPGVERVDVSMTAQTRAAGPAGSPVMKDVKNVVAVASGKGGVGKSTVAANLALALARTGASVGLLDADIYGPSMPMMFGTSERPQAAGEKRIHPVEAHGIKLMSIGFLVDTDQPMVWRGPMVHGALNQFMEQVEWGSLDYVVVDMPPGTGDAQLTLTQRAPLAGAVIVTTPQDVALIDARKGLRMFEQVKVPVLGIVENMAWFTCGECGTRHDVFRTGGGRRTAEQLGVPFLGEVPLEPAVPVSGDEGTPIVARDPQCEVSRAFLAVAGEIARELAMRGMASETSPSGLSMNWQG